MIVYEHKFRVGYPDTDQMGSMHHANYARHFETARWELFRSIGIPYQSVEEAGYMLPVTRMNFRFIKPTRYDEQLTVKTTLIQLKGVRIWFDYKLFNEQKEIITEAETELAFVKKGNWKPCAVPDFILNCINANKNI